MQEFLELPMDYEREQNSLARLLPDPLYILHTRVRRCFPTVQPTRLSCLGLWIRIRIHFPSWIRIQEGKIEEKKQQEKCNNCYFIIIYEVNLDQLHGFFYF